MTDFHSSVIYLYTLVNIYLHKFSSNRKLHIEERMNHRETVAPMYMGKVKLGTQNKVKDFVFLSKCIQVSADIHKIVFLTVTLSSV